MFKSKSLLYGAVLFFSIVFISVFFYGYQLLFTTNFNLNKKESYLFIPPKATFQTVLDSLTNTQTIVDPVSFAFLSKLMKYQTSIKPGRFRIPKNSANLSIVRMLRAGIQAPVKVTFNNVRTKEDFLKKIDPYFYFSAAELDLILTDDELLGKYGLDSSTALTLFLPNTYEFYWNTSPSLFLNKMHRQYKKFWTEERLQKAQTLGMKPTEVSILASIVQAETLKEDEKKRVAGVYLNRLEKGMKLQADPTLVFALGDFSIKRVLDRHKQIDSPYNTYKFEGLPPGPINLPDTRSIDAVLNYEQHDYLYFCAREDFSGYHNFAKTYAEHQKFARLYQAALDKAGIR